MPKENEDGLMDIDLDPTTALPADAGRACLIARAWVPGSPPGRSVVLIEGAEAIDTSRSYATPSQLLETTYPAAGARAAKARGTRLGSVAEILANSSAERHDPEKPRFLAPCD